MSDIFKIGDEFTIIEDTSNRINKVFDVVGNHVLYYDINNTIQYTFINRIKKVEVNYTLTWGDIELTEGYAEESNITLEGTYIT